MKHIEFLKKCQNHWALLDRHSGTLCSNPFTRQASLKDISTIFFAWKNVFEKKIISLLQGPVCECDRTGYTGVFCEQGAQKLRN
jgi:hypothetical protein